MSGGKAIRHFGDLIVYRRARELARDVFCMTKSFPKEEVYAMTDQIRRASRSIGAQIAEAWAKRRYERHFLSKLTDADGEQNETQHWLGVAVDCEYITRQQAKELINSCSEIGRMIAGMMAKRDKFCGPCTYEIKEEQEPYITQKAEFL